MDFLERSHNGTAQRYLDQNVVKGTRIRYIQYKFKLVNGINMAILLSLATVILQCTAKSYQIRVLLPFPLAIQVTGPCTCHHYIVNM